MENQDSVDYAIIRHDINGALGIINNFLNAIIHIDLPDDYRECYEAALRGVKKIEGIVNGGGRKGDRRDTHVYEEAVNGEKRGKS